MTFVEHEGVLWVIHPEHPQQANRALGLGWTDTPAGPIRNLPVGGPAAAMENMALPLFRITPIPYAGTWDGGASFWRTICAGNYRFGAEADGDRRPCLVLWQREGWWTITRGWYAVGEVHLRTWSTSRGMRAWTVPAGSLWVVDQRLGYGEHLTEPTTAWWAWEWPEPQNHGLVDSLGRW